MIKIIIKMKIIIIIIIIIIRIRSSWHVYTVWYRSNERRQYSNSRHSKRSEH